jgi:hypothetical protein
MAFGVWTALPKNTIAETHPGFGESYFVSRGS